MRRTEQRHQDCQQESRTAQRLLQKKNRSNPKIVSAGDDDTKGAYCRYTSNHFFGLFFSSLHTTVAGLPRTFAKIAHTAASDDSPFSIPFPRRRRSGWTYFAGPAAVVCEAICILKKAFMLFQQATFDAPLEYPRMMMDGTLGQARKVRRTRSPLPRYIPTHDDRSVGVAAQRVSTSRRPVAALTEFLEELVVLSPPLTGLVPKEHQNSAQSHHSLFEALSA